MTANTSGRVNGEGEAPTTRPGTKPQARWAADLADSIDEVMVLRLMNGTRPTDYTGWERREAVKRLRQAGKLYREIAVRLNIDEQQVWRDLRHFGMVQPRQASA